MRISVFVRRCIVVFAIGAAQMVAASGQTQSDETIRVSTELVQTGVTVVDKNGRFVEGLKPDEFELRVDGVPRPIAFFERVVAGTREEQEKLADFGNKDKSRVPPANQTSNTAVRGRTIVFFIDDLHLSLDSLKRTRDSLLYFIGHKLGSRDQVAIVSASGQIGFLQQFTDNRAVLRAAAARLQQTAYSVLDTEQPTMSEYMALKLEERDRDALSYYVGRCIDENPGYTAVKCALVIKERSREILKRAATVTDRSLSTLEGLLRSTAPLPGRKLVLLVSDGFYVSPRDRNGNAYSALEDITDTARRTGTVIYTIDARGLISGQPDATVNLVDANGVLDKANIGEIPRSQDGLNALAADTGGRATFNKSSITDWVRTTLDETSNYYLLAWLPEQDKADAPFRKIEVSIPSRPDLTVRLPRGYLNSLAVRKSKQADAASSKAPSVGSAAAASKGAPEPATLSSALPVTLSLNYIDVPGAGGVVTSSIQIGSNTLGVDAATEISTVDVAGIILNDQGKQVGDFKTGLAIDRRKTSGGGRDVIYNNRTRLGPGLYLIKVAAKERSSGRVGASANWIEVPDIVRGALTLSSLFLDFRQVRSAGNVAAAATQVQFSVDHRFSEPLQLSYLSFVYNAATGADGKVALTAKTEILDQDENVVMTSPTRNISATNVDDRKRIPIAGEIRQPHLAPGTYELRVTVSDLVAGKAAAESTVFTVN
jgi:VWFA-related protein